MKFLLGLSAYDYNKDSNFLKSFETLIGFLAMSGKEIIWYSSPAYDKKYNSRKLNLAEYPMLKEQVKIIKKYNQSLELALNTTGLLFDDIHEGIKKFKEDFGEFVSIVTLNEYIPCLLDLNIPLTYSFNNVSFLENLRYCKTVVFGKRYIRDIDLMRKFKEDGLKIELVVNSGCHFYCNRQCGSNGDCVPLFLKRVYQVGKLQCLAEQSLLPEELQLYPEDLIDIIKIATRPASLGFIQKTFIDYSTKNTSFSFKDLELVKNWAYYSRQTNIHKALANERVPVFEVIDKKEKIWMNIYKNNSEMQEKVRKTFNGLREKLVMKS